MTTPLLKIVELVQAQAEPYSTVNEALRVVEALLCGVKSASIGGPPASTVDGDAYLVDSLSSSWIGSAIGDVAVACNGGWLFVKPSNGLELYVQDDKLRKRFVNGSWEDVVTSGVSASASVEMSVDETNVLWRNVGDAEWQVLVALDALRVGPTGPVGPAGGTKQFLAGETISGHLVVKVEADGQMYRVSASVLEDMWKVVGITSAAVLQGAYGDTVFAGDITEPSWNWIPGKPVFLLENGALSQTPPTAGFMLVLGVPISSTQLRVTVGTPLALA